jgi:hypothetical protein
VPRFPDEVLNHSPCSPFLNWGRMRKIVAPVHDWIESGPTGREITAQGTALSIEMVSTASPERA